MPHLSKNNLRRMPFNFITSIEAADTSQLGYEYRDVGVAIWLYFLTPLPPLPRPLPLSCPVSRLGACSASKAFIVRALLRSTLDCYIIADAVDGGGI